MGPLIHFLPPLPYQCNYRGRHQEESLGNLYEVQSRPVLQASWCPAAEVLVPLPRPVGRAWLPEPRWSTCPSRSRSSGLFLPSTSSTGPHLACFLHREELGGGYGETRTEKGEESWSPEAGGVGRVRWGGDQQEGPLVTHTEAMPLGFFFFLPWLPLPRLREELQEMETDRNTSGRKQQERKK